MSDEGGEAACWLDRVCPECGALNDGAEASRQDCWRCGWRPENTSPDPAPQGDSSPPATEPGPAEDLPTPPLAE